MTAPEPTGWELQRTMEQLRSDVKTGFDDLKELVGKSVSRELLDAKLQIRDERIGVLEDWQTQVEARGLATRRYWPPTVAAVLAGFAAAGTFIATLIH